MLSKGQRDDFFAYTSTGAVGLCLLGGLPIAITVTVVGACVAGAIANRNGRLMQELTIDEKVQHELRVQFGDDAVESYRQNRANGMAPQTARTAIYEALQKNADRQASP